MVCGGRAAGVEIGPTAEQAGTSANEGLPKRTAAGLFYLITAKGCANSSAVGWRNFPSPHRHGWLL